MLVSRTAAACFPRARSASSSISFKGSLNVRTLNAVQGTSMRRISYLTGNWDC